MTLLVFGAGGQLGLDLERRAGGDAPFLFLGRGRVDLAAPEACAEAITRTRPGAVINAAGVAGAAAAEADEAHAHRINAEAPGAMARAAAALGIPFVQISCAAVLEGAPAEAPLPPETPPAPLTALGRSKAAGEAAVRDAGGPHVILRAGPLISPFGASGAALETFLDHAMAEEEITLPLDGPPDLAHDGPPDGPHDGPPGPPPGPEAAPQEAQGAPTPAWDLAGAAMIAAQCLMADPRLTGTYHYQGAPAVGPAGFARALLAASELPCTVTEGPAQGPLPAPLPVLGFGPALACTRTEAAFGLRRPDWRAGLGPLVATLTARRKARQSATRTAAQRDHRGGPAT